MHKTAKKRFLSEHEAGEYLSRSAAAMRFDRHRRRGPAYYRIGRRVLYRVEDLDKFVEARRVEGSEPSMRLITSPDGKQ